MRYWHGQYPRFFATMPMRNTAFKSYSYHVHYKQSPKNLITDWLYEINSICNLLAIITEYY